MGIAKASPRVCGKAGFAIFVDPWGDLGWVHDGSSSQCSEMVFDLFVAWSGVSFNYCQNFMLLYFCYWEVDLWPEA